VKTTTKRKIHFITYGDEKYSISKKHLIGLARHSNFFDSTKAFGPKDIDTDFKKKYGEILSTKRGGGYWLWKYYFINKLINQTNENDLIVYCDAGASLNFYAKKRFQDYVDIISDSKYGNFRIECEPKFLEYEWTTSEIFSYFNVDPYSKIGKSVQLEGGHMIFKNVEHTKNYLNEFSKLMEFDKDLITDKYNKKNQIHNFKENRHDQSIFSLLSKVHGCEFVENETEFKERPELQYEYPFLSVRKGGHGYKDRLKFYLFYYKKIKTPVYFELLD